MALVSNIERYLYDKTRILDPGQGYWLRNNGTFKRPLPSRIVVHTTSNRRKNTSFTAEARFIAESPNISAHYLVGKEGQVVRFLVPQFHIAWHTGSAIAGWNNYETIGVEVHVSQGEQWTSIQRATLGNLIIDLAAVYPTIGDLRTHVDTHRTIALPKGRKSDPEGFPDTEFYAWRKELQLMWERLAIVNL